MLQPATVHFDDQDLCRPPWQYYRQIASLPVPHLKSKMMEDRLSRFNKTGQDDIIADLLGASRNGWARCPHAQRRRKAVLIRPKAEGTAFGRRYGGPFAAWM